MRGVNKVILVGNLGNDPDTTYSGSGTAITKLSIATSESWTDKQSGEKQERTEWHRVTMFGRLAEIAGEYCRKGGQVYVEGKLSTNKYTDKEGIERWSTEIIANEMQLLGGRPGDSGQRGAPRDQGGGQGRGDRQQERGAGRSGGHGGGQQQQQQPAPADQGFDDEEIPFN